MALNTYDADKHHIGLGPAGEYGFMLVGAYSKDSQREVGGAAEYGGQQDLIGQAPGRSRWTQDDFTGGAFQYRYERDVAMFSESIGFVPGSQTRSLLTVAPVVECLTFEPALESNPASISDTRTPKAMFSVAGSVFVVFGHGIARYRHDLDSFTWGFPVSSSQNIIVSAAYDMNEQIYYGLYTRAAGAGSPPELVRFQEDFTVPTNQSTWAFDADDTLDRVAKGFQINDAQIVAGIGLRLYTVAPPVDTTSVDGAPTITDIGRLPGYWVDSTSYNGMTYILCAAVDGRTALVAFDGTAVLPICDFPFNFNGRCVQVYGGRIYVGGTGYNLSGGEKYAELHEVTGASVRLVRTFSPESRQSTAPAHFPTVIRDFAVAEGLLWMAMDGDRLLAYDLISDGFFGASEILLSTLKPYKMTVCRGHLYVWNRDASDSTKDGLYRIAASTDTFSAYTAKLTTSDFIAEPDVSKTWSSLTVQARYAQPTAEYSSDSGATWTSLGAGTTTTEGNIYTTRFDMSAVPNSKHIRFRISLARSANSTDYAELIAYTCAFVFASTGKHGWVLNINGAETIEGRDATDVEQDVALLAETIWGWRDTQLVMKDIDGSERKVFVQHVTEQQPIIGPNITTRPEAYFGITLVEV